jgi:hypothetical protein
MINPYHTEFKHNPTLRHARLLNERLPRALLTHTGRVLDRPFQPGTPRPLPINDKIQKRRRHQSQARNYMEQPAVDNRQRNMH